MLGRVGGRNFLERDPAVKRPLYEEVRKLALERYGDEIDEYLAFNARVRSHLLRNGDYEGLDALATYEGRLETEATVVELEPEEEEAVGIAIESRIRGLAFERQGDRVVWTPPEALAGHLTADQLDVTDEIDRCYADILIWSARDGTEFSLRSDTETRLEGGTAVLTTRARLQPRVVVAKANLRNGEWTVGVYAAAAGFAPVGVPAMRGRRPMRVPLVVTITKDGRALPPTPRGDVARRFPGVARVFRKTQAGSAG